MNTFNKKAFDPEYMTQWRKEFEYLHSRGIEPTFIRISKYGIPEYKYRKTPELFTVLVEFYTAVKENADNI